MPRTHAAAHRWRRHRIDLALVLLVLALTAPIVQEMRAQQASRLALTAAIWDDHSLRIDGYPIGIDRAERDGHVYSDKAPGQPVFALPAYAAYRALGGEPATVLRVEGNLGLWAVSVWSSTVPMAALVLLLRRAADRVRPGTGVPVATIVLVATMFLPFSSLLFGHVLAAGLAFAGWYLVSRPAPSGRALAVSGALVAASVVTEYTLALAAVAIAMHVAVVARTHAWRFAAGGAPFVLALLAYQGAAFGSPFKISYSSSSFSSAAQEAGVPDLHLSHAENAIRVMVGERGMLVVSPVLALAMVGMVLLIRARPGLERSAHLAAAGSAAGVLAVQLLWSNPTGGDAPGPRYATAAAAFLVPGLAVAWARWRRPCVALGAVGGLIMLAATWTNPLEARDSTNAVGIWLDKLLHGDWTLTIYEMALGRWSVVLLPVGVLAATVFLGAAAAGPRNVASRSEVTA